MSKAYCQNWRGFLATDEKVEGAWAIARGRCKQWSCAYCGEILRLSWRAHLSKEIQRLDLKQWCFFTLTFGSFPSQFTPEQIRDETYRLQKRYWDIIMKRLKRQYGKFQYVRVLELQKRGAVHIHCIASFHFSDIKIANEGKVTEYSYSEGLKQDAKDIGFGFMTHAENLDNEIAEDKKRVAGYITKYITKSDRGTGLWIPKNARFLQTSQGIRAFNKKKEGKGLYWVRWGNDLKRQLQISRVYSLKYKRYVLREHLDKDGQYFED